jgi:hypothetical protein
MNQKSSLLIILIQSKNDGIQSIRLTSLKNRLGCPTLLQCESMEKYLDFKWLGMRVAIVIPLSRTSQCDCVNGFIQSIQAAVKPVVIKLFLVLQPT